MPTGTSVRSNDNDKPHVTGYAMSGGSYDYIYHRIEEAAAQIGPRRVSYLREWFAKHLLLVAEAMHDVEWVDSGDYLPGDEDAAIRAVMSHGRPRKIK